jgi:hypothetical protein
VTPITALTANPNVTFATLLKWLSRDKQSPVRRAGTEPVDANVYFCNFCGANA